MATHEPPPKCELLRLSEGKFCEVEARHTFYEKRQSKPTYACCRCFNSWFSLREHKSDICVYPAAATVADPGASPDSPASEVTEQA